MDIDKLRNIAATLAISYDPAISDEDIATISDAADEIERLRAEAQELRLELIAAYGQQQEAALRGEDDQ